MEIGQFQVYTGDGKGKITAALGLALRASVHLTDDPKDVQASSARSKRSGGCPA